MKIAGIVLLCLQVFAVVSGISSGTLMDMGIAELIGYFLPGFIGAILIWKAKKKESP